MNNFRLSQKKIYGDDRSSIENLHNQKMDVIFKKYDTLDTKKKELLFNNYTINNSLEFKDISFGFKENKKNIFENLNFKISSGEIIGIEGENGVGKSTFLKIVSGLIKPSSGEIIIDGKKIENWRNSSWNRFLDRIAT